MGKLTKEKFFYIFLFINSIVWIFVEMVKQTMSIDAQEAVIWGELHDFGTNKHPPLSGWIMSFCYNTFGQNDIIAYVLGQIFLILGLIFIYKLAKFFMSEEKSICASMIMTVCFYYTYMVFIDNFNCNIMLMGLIPAISYYYYKAVKEGKTSDWVIYGIVSGLAVITKYQIVFFFLALFIHLVIFERKEFLRKGLYIAVIIGTVIIAPHVLWLFKHDFFSFSYMVDQATGSEDDVSSVIQRIFFPIKFVGDQILSLGACYFVYALLAIYSKNISIGNKEGKIGDKIFLLSICFVPMVAQGLMGAFTGNMLHGVWGSIMVCFGGIILFYFFPIQFQKDEFKFFVKTIIPVLILIIIAIMLVFHLHIKRAYIYPYDSVINDFHRIWAEKTNNAPLKYVGGDIAYTPQFRIYDKTHPFVLLESFEYKNPWYDHEDILKSGALIIAKTPESLDYRTRDAVYLLPEDYKIDTVEYTFKYRNKLGKEKEYLVYYTIIPPQTEN